MSRISRHQMFMEVAEVLAKRSTCYRNGVGALLVQGKIPVSWGYNGPPSGEHHCQGESCPLDGMGKCVRSIHAEKNALTLMTFIDPGRRLTLYTTGSPCPDCAGDIISFMDGSIERVVYRSPYSDEVGLDFLIEYNLSVFRLTPSGYMIDYKTGEMRQSEEIE